MSEISISTELVKRENELNKVLKDCENKLKKAPSGKLKIINHKGKTSYYLRKDGYDKAGKYVKKNEFDKAKRIAQRDYEIDVKNAVNKELSAISSFKKKMPPKTYEHAYEDLISARKVLITPHFLPDEEFVKSWLEEPYEVYARKDEKAQHFTDSGEQVRSKSEVMIANALRKTGIAYKYECPLFLGNTKVHPDFTILKMPSRKVVYWEHLGRLDDPEYLDKNLMHKLDEYEENGIFLGDGLIITRETSEIPLNIKKVMAVIEHYLM
ncbi:hypothetical protein [Butyrivibrio sp. AD3002]|uniref:hypothetical protein n=1 Tax=Butyrivibrio sp. AD3002 TaxID=1280670 RepID=UPI0003B43B89|nr:hypothetical protein [Butyrivibrio sp. AD3002]